LFFLQPVPLGAEVVDFAVHPRQKQFGGGGGYSGPLKRKDFLALPSELDAHTFDFPPDVVEVWQFSPPFVWRVEKNITRTYLQVTS
jgi:hypothetical protein